jgi:hypothetical protein
MLAAVGFNADSGLQTKEIDDVTGDGDLLAEVETVDLTSPQEGPEFFLCVRGLLAHSAGAGDQSAGVIAFAGYGGNVAMTVGGSSNLPPPLLSPGVPGAGVRGGRECLCAFDLRGNDRVWGGRGNGGVKSHS